MKRTLEEAIKYYSELAEENEKDAEQFKRIKATQDMISHCYECAKKHRMLADWLKALKEIWDSGSCNDCRNGQCEWKPKLGQLVRYNCPHYVGIGEEVNTDDE